MNMKTFAAEVWSRVVVSYKSTMIGLAAGIGLIAVDQFTTWLGAQSQPWAQALAALVVLVGAALKSKALPPATP